MKINGRNRTVARLLTATFTASLAGIASAGDGLFGTKSSPIGSTSAGTGSAIGIMPIAQMLVALLIVLALLKWLMPNLIKKVGTRSSVSGKGIRIQETAAIGAGNLYVVEVRGKSFLVGATPNSVSYLADLTDSRPQEPLTFQEMVDAAPARPSFAESSISDALEQLGRLKRLGS